MTVAEAIEVLGDYTLKGPDYDTILIGPVFAEYKYTLARAA